MSVDADGWITLNGTASADSTLYSTGANIPAQLDPVILSIGITAPTGFFTGLVKLGGSAGLLEVVPPKSSNSAPSVAEVSRFRILFLNGTTFANFKFRPQLELGSVATPYEPYAGNDYNLLTAEQDFYGLPGAPAVVDAEAGTVKNQTGFIPSYDGETVPAGWISSTGALTTGAQVVYPLAAPEIIPITPPVINALDRLKRTEARQNVLTATANDSTVGVQKQTVPYQKAPIRESDELAAAIAALA